MAKDSKTKDSANLKAAKNKANAMISALDSNLRGLFEPNIIMLGHDFYGCNIISKKLGVKIIQNDNTLRYSAMICGQPQKISGQPVYLNCDRVFEEDINVAFHKNATLALSSVEKIHKGLQPIRDLMEAKNK